MISFVQINDMKMVMFFEPVCSYFPVMSFVYQYNCLVSSLRVNIWMLLMRMKGVKFMTIDLALDVLI